MKYVIGIDEVGRGPVAGPVTVGAFKLQSTIYKLQIKKAEKQLKIKLKDSKKLSRIQREQWFKAIKKWKQEGVCDFTIVSVSAKEIDRIGISPAIKKCISVCLYKLCPSGDISRRETSCSILLDGSLKAPKEFINQKTIIKGDEKELVISLASIVAKVTRDKYMRNQAKKYPVYGFENHVGYGTKKHYTAIQKNGLTPLHRRSFLKNKNKK
jgi:ribonuclease HII